MKLTVNYLIPIAFLIAALAAFFALARGRYRPFGIGQLVLRGIVALPLLVSAVAVHFLRTNEATSMMPPVFPQTKLLVLLTGVLEILGALGLFVPRTSRSAALGIAVLMVVVFPVNVFVAGQTFGGLQMPSVPVRTAMQIVYIWMVLLAGYGLPGREDRGSQSKSEGE